MQLVAGPGRLYALIVTPDATSPLKLSITVEFGWPGSLVTGPDAEYVTAASADVVKTADAKTIALKHRNLFIEPSP